MCIRLLGAVVLVSAAVPALTCMACVARGEANASGFVRVLEEIQRAYAQIDLTLQLSSKSDALGNSALSNGLP
jgi:hypothetical protein